MKRNGWPILFHKQRSKTAETAQKLFKDRAFLALYRKDIAAFDGIATTYRIKLWDKSTLVWDFHSLPLDIRFLLSTMLTDDHTPLRICRHCYKPFIASNPDEEFCSEECSKARENRT